MEVISLPITFYSDLIERVTKGLINYREVGDFASSSPFMKLSSPSLL
jgi:hypothetical protein